MKPAILLVMIALPLALYSVAYDFRSVQARLDVQPKAPWGTLHLSGNVSCGREALWRVLTSAKGQQCTHTKAILEYRTRMIGPGLYEAYYLLDFPWPLEDRWQLLRISFDKSRYLVSWQLVRGTVRRSIGYYQLRELGPYTRIEYRAEFDPGLSYVPNWAVRYVVRDQAPKIIENLRRCCSLR